jgi:hypothetical protein
MAATLRIPPTKTRSPVECVVNIGTRLVPRQSWIDEFWRALSVLVIVIVVAIDRETPGPRTSTSTAPLSTTTKQPSHLSIRDGRRLDVPTRT